MLKTTQGRIIYEGLNTYSSQEKLEEAIKVGCTDFQFIAFSNCELKDVQINNCIFSRGSFEETLFQNVVFNNCLFVETNFRGATFNNVKFNKCKMTTSDFRDSTLCSTTVFLGCKLNYMYIDSVNIRRIELDEAHPIIINYNGEGAELIIGCLTATVEEWKEWVVTDTLPPIVDKPLLLQYFETIIKNITR